MKKGFDSKKYLELQSREILKRIEMFDNKLYLELGGKLFDDYHASRCIPGFRATGKVELLYKLRKKAEVIFCINANDIEKNKIRADLGITYDLEVLRLIDNLRSMDIEVNSVVITLFTGQSSALIFQKRLEKRNIKTYIHTPTKGYPTDIDLIVSDNGYGANPYIETTKPLIIVTAPGANSGKLGTCLSQIYHEYKRGVKAGYAKYETFPVWNLPLKHPLNAAYEASTADLKDVNMVDYFHLETYGKTSVNYNRDLTVFPILKSILTKISGTSMYNSPTDMGVNTIGSCITDDDVVKSASRLEIIRRYYRALGDCKKGLLEEDVPNRIKILMDELGINIEERKTIKPALEKSRKEKRIALAIELSNGKIITGKETEIMSAPASAVVNSIKYLGKIKDDIHLIAPVLLEPMLQTKQKILGMKKPILTLQEVILALNISAATNPIVEASLKKLSSLANCDAHASHFISSADEESLRSLKITLTTEPEFSTENLYFEEV